MMKSMEDLKYICTNLTNLTNLPVRLYKQDELVFFSSLINIIKDPFILDKEASFRLKDSICYFQNAYYYFYGIINFDDYKIRCANQHHSLLGGNLDED